MATADLIVRAARLHTMGPASPPATMVVVADGKILAVGDDRLADEFSRTEVLDLGPATLTPGLIDGHFHPVYGLGLTSGIDLTRATTVAEVIQTLHANRGDGPWVRGWGLDPNVFGREPISNSLLIEAFGPDVPAFVTLFDAHSAIATPAALAAAKITGSREFAAGGMIVCDDDGTPNGHLREFEAMTLVESVMPAESPQTRRRRLGDLLQAMASVGITAGNAMDFSGDSAELVTALEAAGELPLRLRFHPWVEPGGGVTTWEHVLEQQRLRGRRWKVDGAKFFMDGTVEGGTAWLTEPDSCGECHAPNWSDPTEYRAAVHFLAHHGVPTATHAIGDAAVRWALETLSGAAPLDSGARHRIEHIETIPDDLIPTFADLGVVASVQPTHCTDFNSADFSDAWSQRLGPARAAHGFRFGDIRRAGAVVAFGSDWPVAPFDPRAILSAARLRRRGGHPEQDPIGPEQAVTARMALEAYTTHAAISQGEAGTAGVIAPGARASFTAFTADPLSTDPDEFALAPIAATIVEGQLVHLASD
ncbi:amidohydrolase [Embleya sp. MST-111070]|uniref:amidohydrolase n=1 Tax=Embleya sp. MST-111070 TaxID=3398231 RepID=UPI003F7395E4